MGVVIEAGMRADELQKILPHRFPFFFVDKILEKIDGPHPQSREGARVIALKNVTINEPYFVGHFPHRPVVPGVLLVEIMAQVGALAAYRSTDPPMDVAIAFIKNARFRVPALPGDSLIIKSEIIRDRKSMLLMSGVIEVNEQKVAEAEVMAHMTVSTSPLRVSLNP